MRRYFERYRDGVRLNHWFVAMLFVLAGATGIALFHPLFFPLTQFFGGGQWTRILHPFMGVAMVLGFALLFKQVWHENIWVKGDTAWAMKARDLIKGNKKAMPKIGKYNPGQKGVFWAFGASLVLLFVSGFFFWQPWFADVFPVPLRRVAVVVHALAAFVLILSVIVHVYAAIWVKGTMRAMTRGTVSEDWARYNHPLWYDEMARRPAVPEARLRQ